MSVTSAFTSVTVWLARGSVLATGIVSPSASANQLYCAPIASTNDTVTCVLPGGHGVGWRVFVVNNDTAAGADLAALRSATFQASAASAHAFSYAPPNVTAGEGSTTGIFAFFPLDLRLASPTPRRRPPHCAVFAVRGDTLASASPLRVCSFY